LFGFIFLITQFFQFVKGYGPLSTGVHLLPVALSVGIGSVAGTQLAVRVGTKLVVTVGLVAMAAFYGWVAATTTATLGYGVIAVQMVLYGLGMGLTSAPATESIMGAVSRRQAGVGSGRLSPRCGRPRFAPSPTTRPARCRTGRTSRSAPPYARPRSVRPGMALRPSTPPPRTPLSTIFPSPLVAGSPRPGPSGCLVLPAQPAPFGSDAAQHARLGPAGGSGLATRTRRVHDRQRWGVADSGRRAR
jgi:hypothetical protein